MGFIVEKFLQRSSLWLNICNFAFAEQTANPDSGPLMKDIVEAACPEPVYDPEHIVKQQSDPICSSISKRREMWSSVEICELGLLLFKAQDL